MVCFRYITVNTLHNGDIKDNNNSDYNDNKNNNLGSHHYSNPCIAGDTTNRLE